MTEQDQKPPRIEPRLKAAPQIKRVYWCDFPLDAQLPEFWKTRPVLILSKSARLYGNVTVLPITTAPQPDNPMAHPIISPINGLPAAVICDYITTVAVSRLSPPDWRGKGIPRVSDADFIAALKLAFGNLPDPDY